MVLYYYYFGGLFVLSHESGGQVLRENVKPLVYRDIQKST